MENAFQAEREFFVFFFKRQDGRKARVLFKVQNTLGESRMMKLERWAKPLLQWTLIGR